MTSCAFKSPSPQRALLLTGVASVTIDVRWRISRSECGMQDPPFAFAGAEEAADEESEDNAEGAAPSSNDKRPLLAGRGRHLFHVSHS